MALSLPVAVGIQPPVMTSKMIKMLPGYLKKQRGPLAQRASEMQTSVIENTLSQEYGASFHSMDRSNLSGELRTRPVDLLLNAVQALKDGAVLDSTIIADAFVVAFALMDVANPVTQHLQPGELEFNTAQVILLQVVAYISGSKVVTPGTYHVDEQRVIRVVCWGSGLLAIPVYFGETLQVSEPREYLIFPKPDPVRYRGNVTVTSVVSGFGGQEFLCEGAHIIISCVHPHIDLATAQQNGVHSSLARKAEVLLGWFIAAPSSNQIQRYLAAAERKQPVVFLRRNLGLTNPAAPFHESSAVVFLDAEEDVEKVLQLADEIPCGLSRHFFDFQTGMVPFTFPPAIDDWDQQMQESMMRSGVPFADDAEAASYFAQKLEDATVDLTQVEDEIDDLEAKDEDPPVIAHAKQLARDALLCLRKHHVVVRWVSEILDDIIDQAAYQGRIKQEQERISRRWEEEPKLKQNRHAAKRERKKQGQKAPEVEEMKAPTQSATQRLRGILNDFTNKVFKYQHYRKAFHALQSTGLLAHVGCESVHGSHHVLHASGTASATLVMPHGASSEHRCHRFTRSLMNIAAQVQDVT